MLTMIGANNKTSGHRCRRRRRWQQTHQATISTTTRAATATTAMALHMSGARLLIVMNLLLACSWHNQAGHGPLTWVQAVSVQRLNVPDLVVIDQLNQQQQSSRSVAQAADQQQQQRLRTQNNNLNHNHPEAASLINSNDLSSNDQQSQITFECLISFDKKKDKNLIVKWHHDDRIEPIYQWIPELNKRSIAPQYRAYIVPIVSTATAQHQYLPPTTGAASIADLQLQQQPPFGSLNQTHMNSNQTSQLLEAGFRLVKPTKELGGKYTCSAISTQNDDSKWKKMIVYTPPRVFRFNASRTDIGAQLASQRERLIQLTRPAMIAGQASTFSSSNNGNNQLPLAYRMRGFESMLSPPTTIPPQMYSTIDYVNVNQQRTRQASSASASAAAAAAAATAADSSSSFSPSFPWLLSPPTQAPISSGLSSPTAKLYSSNSNNKHQQNGVKLVCDIDQVFPVPEVSIYRLAKLDGSHPDKLAKLDTRIDRDPLTGLFHVQVISILEDDELQMKYGQNEPVYFECLIALTNLELSKYADNKRSIVYRPGLLTTNSLQQGVQTSEDIIMEQAENSANPICPSSRNQHCHLLFNVALALILGYFYSVRTLMLKFHRPS